MMVLLVLHRLIRVTTPTIVWVADRELMIMTKGQDDHDKRLRN
jgi:hypothetical protein